MNIKRLLFLLMHVNLCKFIWFNFFSKNIIRNGKYYLFPIRGTKLILDRTCKIELNGNLVLNDMKHKGSHEETILHICAEGLLQIKGEVSIASNSSIDILKNAEISLGQLNANYGMVVVCANKMIVEENVEFGRNVILYDSSFHPTEINKKVNGRPLHIKKHVWLCTGVCIAKGVTIGEGAICGINSTVTRNVKDHTMVMGNPAKCMMENVEW